MKIFTLALSGFMVLASTFTNVQAHSSDEEAAIILGGAAIVAGIIAGSSRHRHYHHDRYRGNPYNDPYYYRRGYGYEGPGPYLGPYPRYPRYPRY